MKTSPSKISGLLKLAAAFVILLALFSSYSLVIAAPAETANEPCAAPDPGLLGGLTLTGVELQVAGFDAPPPRGGGAPNGVITCLHLDQTHYQVGSTWQATMLVQNFGNASTGDTMQVFFDLCRRAEDGIQQLCYSQPFSAATIFALEPGESQLVQFSGSFNSLPTDPNPSYASWIPGIPNNLDVWIKVDLAQYSSELGVSAIAEAVYPSAPEETPECTQPLFSCRHPPNPDDVDEDGDGWYAGDDCNDTDPNVHPYANEIWGDSIDQDCSAGDVGGTLGCPEPPDEIYTYDNQYPGICDGPPGSSNVTSADLDQDSWLAQAPGVYIPPEIASDLQLGDCDDLNSAVYPGAPELFDGLDNNCNGWIDEAFSTPDWVIMNYSLTRGSQEIANNFTVDGFYYEIEIGNEGEYIGDDFSSVQAVYQTIPFGSPEHIVAFGTSGFIPYNMFPDEVAEAYACAAAGLVAQIPTSGIWGEVNFANNAALANAPALGASTRSIHFEETPTVTYNNGEEYLRLTANAGTSGECPALSISEIGTEGIQIRWRVLYNGQVVYDEVTLEDVAAGTSGLAESQIFQYQIASLPQALNNSDYVCVEIQLDPNRYVGENHSDNGYYLTYQYQAHTFIPDELVQVADLLTGIVSYATYPASFNCNAPPSTGGALTSSESEVLDQAEPIPTDTSSPLGIAQLEEDGCPTPTPLSALNQVVTPQIDEDSQQPCELAAEREIPSGPKSVGEP